MIADKVIAAIERNEKLPWMKPWSGGGLARNGKTQRPYTGVNFFLTACCDYANPNFLTFNQANEFGLSVRKGEKATVVVFWKPMKVRKEDAGEDGDKADKIIPFLRYYNVFNVDQLEGDIPEKMQIRQQREKHEAIAEAEAVIAAMPKAPPIKIEGARACYSPILDEVRMPQPTLFKSSEGYYQTLFHELVHSTGHPSRLNRKEKSGSFFGNTVYAFEELVAESGSAMLAARCGFDTTATVEQSAAYAQGWLRVLKDEPKKFLEAAQKGSKAVDFITNVSYNNTVAQEA
jgi:antirestriction protein ArdC